RHHQALHSFPTRRSSDLRRSVQAEWNVARKLVPNASELDSKNSGEEVLNEGPHTGIIDSFACRNRLSGAGHGSVGFQSKGGRTAKTTRRTAQTNEQARGAARRTAKQGDGGDRKSTRLNSSHDQISYAVFC